MENASQKKRWEKEGKRLRALRKEIQRREGWRITQAEFAKRFRVYNERSGKPSVRKVNSYESGECKIPMTLLSELRQHGYSLDEMLFKQSVVEEELTPWQKDPKRLRLVAEIKDLIQFVPDDVIDALLRTVKIFKRAKTEKEAL